MASTRHQILEILKQIGPSTVDELAMHVGVKEGTIRHHLTSLRADGLVDIDLRRQAVGRPAHIFHVVVQSDQK